MSVPPKKSELPSAPPTDSAFIGGGEMGKLVRAKDWSRTPLGPIASWSPGLRTAVSLVLNSNFPIALAWGPHHVQIYNDGYWPICGDKHPTAMGQDFSECWASAFPVIGDAFRSALAGTSAFLEDQRMFLDRLGYLEETFFTFSFSPIRDERGAVAGLFHPVTETTGKMVGQRRTRTLRDLTAIGLEAHSVDEAFRRTAQSLAEATLDVPFALCYRIDADRRAARLVAQAGLSPGGNASPMLVDLTGADPVWPLAKVGAGDTAMLVDDLRTRFPGLVCGPYPEPIAAARLLPIAPPGFEQALGVMVVGVSTRLPMNEAYTGFHELLASTVGNVVASALTAEAERRRVAALAEIDRAKTAFFTNISHEFRTPLTLMLAPLEDELAERTAPLPAPRRERLEAAHRNSLRLLKLVNSLLDFSRIEAGRAKANYQTTDLAAYTAELASMFRSAIEKAGLTLTVDCPALPEPVFVDREMWEKIVLNLLSNAFKHTFSGGIRVALHWGGAQVELDVTDTGIGISAADLPGLFERFRQVKGVRARTHEGTGIGLSLVRELAQMHGGTVRAASEPGKGSTFTVSLKTGRSHLRTEEIAAPSALQASTARVASYVEEALQWIPVAPASPVAAAAGAERARILWADDNADMRNYVQRLLSAHYDVTAVSNGADAVAAAFAAPPDLVLTDIMMPILDGYGVLRELRADERTRLTPVILLSARAGEDAVVDGTESGADDYLVKPFTARELLARVRAHLGLAKLRREWLAAQARAAALERAAVERSKQLAATEESRRALLGILEDQQRAEAERRASEQTLQRTLDAAHIGHWNLDLVTHAAIRSRRHDQIFGYEEPPADWSYEKFLTHVHPEDRGRVDRLFQAGVAAKTLWDFECRITRHDGALRWIWGHGNVFTNTAGEPVRMLGMVSDITGRKQAEEERRQSEEKFSRVFHVGPAGMTITRVADGKFLDVNESFLRMFECSREEAIGHTSLELNMLSPDERSQLIQRQRESGGLHNAELLARAKSGRLLNLLFSSKPIQVNGEDCLVTTLIDITERKQAEAKLREANQHAADILEAMSDAFVTWDKNWLYTYVNAAAERTLRRRREELLGRNILDLFHPDPKDPARVHYERAMAERIPIHFEIFYPPLQIWTEVHVYPTAEGGLSLFFRDITERKQAEELLREHTHQLQTLSKRVLEAQEVERRRLARELHDELGQALTAIKINLQARDRLNHQSPTESDTENLRIVEDALQQVRRLALALRPSMLDDLGIGPALRWMAEQQAERSGYTVHFGADFPDTRLAPELETTCFRISQEALTNIARHAQAKRVAIELRHEGDTLVMTVQDDGRGFDVAAMRERAKAGGSTGMLGMQERAALIGGQLEIESAPGRGTTLRVRFPWRACQEAG
ncbi:MAG: PAS domain S-box protein [Gammaproteobacteria bacterium]|nr:PAS domain S-box protein [Gammaproteobacteria bacterium]